MEQFDYAKYIKNNRLFKENYGDDTYNIGMKQYTTSKPKLSQNETEKIKGADGAACWKGYRYAGTKDGKVYGMWRNDGYATAISRP
jgi:bisphosphoglycerate-dependent phosphoglycerate mutase